MRNRKRRNCRSMIEPNHARYLPYFAQPSFMLTRLLPGAVLNETVGQAARSPLPNHLNGYHYGVVGQGGAGGLEVLEKSPRATMGTR